MNADSFHYKRSEGRRPKAAKDPARSNLVASAVGPVSGELKQP